MKKILILALVAGFALSGPIASADFELNPGDWQIKGSHPLVFTCGGSDYSHTLDNGFPGTGHYDANPAYTWNITGDIVDDSITFTLVYTGINAGYTLNGVGTINPDGSVTGTVDNNCQTFAMPANTATMVTPEDIMAAADSYIHGGGHIIEKLGNKRKDWHDISFGGWLAQSDDELLGEWQVNLHNVGGNSQDKSKFHATSFTAFNLFDGNSATCNDAANITAVGTWNGLPDHTMIFRAGDNGSPNTLDTVRVEIYDPSNNKIYDSSSGDFPSDPSSCVGTARTLLDTGNITIYNP